MEKLMLALSVLTAAYQLYVLTRLPAPKMPGAMGKLRRQPETAVTAVAASVLTLFIQGVCIAAQPKGDWRVLLIMWAGSLLFLLMGSLMAFDGVRYGEDGFALRDSLGRVRAYRWADVLGMEQLIIPRKGRGFDVEIAAVYLPDHTLTLRRTLEGTEQPFLNLLREKRPDLPDVNPDGRRVYSDKLQLALSAVLELFLVVLAITRSVLPARYGWLWIPAALWTVYFALQIAAVRWPQRFSDRMRQKLLSPEPRRKN